MQRHLVEYIVTLLGESEGGISEAAGGSPPVDCDVALDVRNFLDQIPGGFLVYKATGGEEIIYANHALIDMVGCSSMEEFRAHTGNSFRGFVHPDDVDEVENSIVEQIKESVLDLDYVEYRIIKKDGTVRRVEDYGHFIHNDVLGDIFYVFITDATEKTEKRIAEKEQMLIQRRQDEDKYRSLVAEMDTAKKLAERDKRLRQEVIEGLSINYESIFYADLGADTVKPFRLNVRTSKHFTGVDNIRQYSEFTAEYIARWVHPDDRKATELCLEPSYIRNKLRDNKTFYHNYRCVCDLGLLHKQLRVVSVGDGSSEIVIGMRNVDEELSLESAQKQVLESALDNARRAAEAKNIFLSNMSHDMRTPLNAIFGFARLARTRRHDPDAVSDLLDKIEKAGDVILGLTEKVLDLTYSESKSRVLDETDFDLTELLTDIDKALRPKALDKNITLRTDCSGITHSRICADRDKLCRVLVQLTENAIKYTNNGGKVSVTAAEAEIMPNGYTEFRIEIADTGVGISETALKNIFDPFERVQNSTSSGVFGPGLGLTLAKTYTELMGGVLEVESEPDVGSVFTVRLGCMVDRSPGVNIDTESVLCEVKEKKILIVEDNEINLEIEQDILSDLGFRTESAYNGKEAIEKLTSEPDDYFAVVLMDIQMPVMDGLQAAERIRKLDNPVLARTPIIAVSANAFDSDKRASAKAGIDAHIAKPLDVSQLLDTIAAVVYGRKHLM